MKTSTTLTILGVYQTLIGCVAMFGASAMAEMALAESYVGDANLVHLATNMHVGVGHAFFMIGILLLASRKAASMWPRPSHRLPHRHCRDVCHHEHGSRPK